MATGLRSEEDKIMIGRRGASRLKISLPAKLETISGGHPAEIRDLSETGAKIRLGIAPRVAADVVLKLWSIEAFSQVVWAADDLVGLKFDEPLSPQQVLAVRAKAETLPIMDRQELAEAGRAWCRGSNR